MSKRKHSPAHDFWHPRVEGQIRDAMHHHPEYFAPVARSAVVNSLAKRIVGEIVAVCAMATDACGCGAMIAPVTRVGGVTKYCSTGAAACVCDVPPPSLMARASRLFGGAP